MPPSCEHYINSVIYTIQHKKIPELLYVGSTSSFLIRSNVHKYNCNNVNSKQHKQKLYQIIKMNGGWDAFNMSIYKKYPCYNRDALLMAEDTVIDELQPLLNKNKAYLTIAQKKQYQIDYKKKNKEKLFKYYRLWMISNKDKLEGYKEKYKYLYTTPEAIAYKKNYYEQHKAKYKQYYQDNKERLKKQYHDNKEKEKEYRAQMM